MNFGQQTGHTHTHTPTRKLNIYAGSKMELQTFEAGNNNKKAGHFHFFVGVRAG
jgi:hypothetical protein